MFIPKTWRGRFAVMLTAGTLLVAGRAPLQAAPAGDVWAWGDNEYGQLGNGTNNESSVPVRISGLSDIVALAAGDDHSLALRSDGTLRAWGENEYGQLGNGTTTDSNVPVRVKGLANVVAIAAGDNVSHSLALKRDGTVWAWGWNDFGQLGNGTNTGASIPVRVTGLDKVVGIAAGWTHSLAVKRDGTVWAWGGNAYGELGNSAAGAMTNVPVQVVGLTDVVAVAAGRADVEGFSLALKKDGTVWAWGGNLQGELGLGETFLSTDVPSQVVGLSDIRSIAAGRGFCLALEKGGTVWAWGDDESGELGNGAWSPEITEAIQVGSVAHAVAISAGAAQSFAVLEDGSAWGWGDNYYGQLGDGTTDDSYIPVQVSDLKNVLSAASGSGFVVAICRPAALHHGSSSR